MEAYSRTFRYDRSRGDQKEKRARPFCRTTGCFDLADVYVVLKETENPDYYDVSKEGDYKKTEKGPLLAGERATFHPVVFR